ncbi:MAG: DUF6428 family protein [Algoriphagus sp.]|uniref:DUF6428 family protein n=1 Tax=Algoriphagus sp. TaxID=1872435 RepID=UPI0027783B8D|nr:DUF6428 family protein [Algoriphagus sp.]
MKLSQVKSQLGHLTTLNFILPDGTVVSPHFHVTEVGQVTKKYIDCGGTLRNESMISFQLWAAEDFDHRLGAAKLLDIIQLAERVLELPDLEVEVEYQGDTIGRYGLEFTGTDFLLTARQTDCLAKDKCGIPTEKPKIRLSSIAQGPICTPNSGCC